VRDRSISVRDPRAIANYTLPEAASWLRVPRNTLRAWLTGQRYSVQGGERRAPPVVEPASAGPLGLSFWNLVECSVLASIRRHHGVSLQKVRVALDFVERELGQERPLIHQQFSTDGVHLFVEHLDAIVSASESGQTVLRDLQSSLQRIERDERGLAARLFPWAHRPTEPRVVSVDPRVSFGRPVLIDTSIPVEVIVGRFRAGESIEGLARDYRVEATRVQDLVRWALEPAAA
jgi:uncharacterized protein (DUF433 family)